MTCNKCGRILSAGPIRMIGKFLCAVCAAGGFFVSHLGHENSSDNTHACVPIRIFHHPDHGHEEPPRDERAYPVLSKFASNVTLISRA